MRYKVAAAYLTAMALHTYLVADTGGDQGFLDNWTFFALLVATHSVVGFAIGRWPALLLIPAAAMIAVPAGYPREGEVPAATMIVIVGLWMLGPAMALGIGARKLYEARSRLATR